MNGQAAVRRDQPTGCRWVKRAAALGMAGVFLWHAGGRWQNVTVGLIPWRLTSVANEKQRARRPLESVEAWNHSRRDSPGAKPDLSRRCSAGRHSARRSSPTRALDSTALSERRQSRVTVASQSRHSPGNPPDGRNSSRAAAGSAIHQLQQRRDRSSTSGHTKAPANDVLEPIVAPRAASQHGRASTSTPICILCNSARA